MKTSSAKAKGRRACQEFRELVLDRLPFLLPDDIKVTPSGVTGEDLHLSPAARRVLPFAIEVKNQEKLNIWQSLAQTIRHCGDTKLKPLLAFRRNRSELFVALRAEDFLALVAESEKLLEEAAYFAVHAQEPESAPAFGSLKKTGRSLPIASDEE